MIFLIADDELLVRITLQKLLNDFGILNEDIHHADNGQSMIEILKCKKIDVAFVDIKMPLLSGLDAIRQCMDISPDTSYYILTGYGKFEYAQQAIKIGVRDFLLKPVDSLTVGTILDRESQQKCKEQKFEREKYTAYISSVLLSHTINENEHLYIIPLLCTCDSDYAPDFDLLYQLERIHPQYKIVLIPTPEYVYLCIVSKSAFHLATIRQCLKQTLEQLLAKHQHMFFSIFCFWNVVDDRNLVSAYQELIPYTHLDVLYGTNKYHLLHEPLKKQYDLFLPFCLLFSKLPQQYKNACYVQFSNTATKVIGEFKKIESALNASNLKNLNLYLKHYFVDTSVTVSDVESLTESLASLSQQLLEKPTKKVTSISHILVYIEEHFAEDISINSLADRFYLTPNYLSSQFKKETSLKFTDYLTNLRLAKAKQLLTESTMQIKQISADVGYATTSHFIKTFVKHEGITPLEYRNQV